MEPYTGWKSAELMYDNKSYVGVTKSYIGVLGVTTESYVRCYYLLLSPM